MERIRSVVLASISNLDQDCKFDIVSNVCGQSACFGSLKSVTEPNRSEAVAWVTGLSSTEVTGIGPIMVQALGDPAYDECMTFILVTDGTKNFVAWQTNIPTHSRLLSRGATIHVVLIPPIRIFSRSVKPYPAAPEGR